MPSAELRSRLEKIADLETYNAVLEHLLSEKQLLMGGLKLFEIVWFNLQKTAKI